MVSISTTFGRWISIELDEERDECLFIPAGCLHDFQTLTDGAVVHYRMDSPFTADAFHEHHIASRALAIDWPLPISIASERAATLPSFEK
ncbi:MAG: dTDP-4-dehydrorhamnose 3,5-epimerase [Candidatus Eremiobacteraeota bacterium]|nr:dTDP-4-dehydrorhamnose 3,5-epimerase [Candidatus Eremiobacteraeota bacterium]